MRARHRVDIARVRAARLAARLEAAEQEWREKPRVYDMLIQFEEAAQRRPAPCPCGGAHKHLPPDPILEAWAARRLREVTPA
jgi:hypothetical protein